MTNVSLTLNEERSKLVFERVLSTFEHKMLVIGSHSNYAYDDEYLREYLSMFLNKDYLERLNIIDDEGDKEEIKTNLISAIYISIGVIREEINKSINKNFKGKSIDYMAGFVSDVKGELKPISSYIL